MKRVTGIGGIFFKSDDPAKLKQWYRTHLGFPADSHDMVVFGWREGDDPSRKGMTIWEPFRADTRYFDPSKAPFMINYRVEDLDAVLAALRDEGVEVEPKIEESEYGRFAWLMDPDGNRLELWEPPAEPE